jgi:ferredoxin
VKVQVDKTKCIGCGTCVALAPKTFKLGDDGKSEAFTQDVDSQETLEQAIQSCPAQAILEVMEPKPAETAQQPAPEVSQPVAEAPQTVAEVPQPAVPAAVPEQPAAVPSQPEAEVPDPNKPV